MSVPHTENPGRAGLRLSGVRKTFALKADTLVALDDVDLECPEGSFTALIGPSGCGKSTILQLAARPEQPDHGEVLVSGRSPQAARHAGLMGVAFQDPALLPWRSTRQNIALPFEVL